MRFLVVDDSATMRRILVSSLTRIGYDDAVEARDEAEALRCFDESISCVIADWNMPPTNGIDLASALRERVGGRSVPVLWVTSRIRADVLDAVGDGVNSYVVKPFTPQGLKEKLEQLLCMVPVGVGVGVEVEVA
jgi:two-component system, chemotaxis family, chemotaxis protein CheY